MASSKHGSKSNKLSSSPNPSKPVTVKSFPSSPPPPPPTTTPTPTSLSTTTSYSSKHFLEPSLDGHSSPASSSALTPTPSKSHSYQTYFPHPHISQPQENVTVTVRFRPLSPREIHQGEDIAWYADGETIVRSENTSSIAYAFDRVFGPTTTTRHVYDIAAQHVVSSSMEGINGTIFAYGVTSSGKTHTMHGDQRSPGIIPLAVKDVFSIIQETPCREFLLRVSYLEIYNEVVNDLLNPAGQNLRIREDAQGTFVEGIKEEVVLSPAHALSLIAAGVEHRHVGSTNLNLLSSRSHTIFTLTIESSPCGENCESEAVNLSQLNLIDLAGSESSKTETTGMRRKEGSYINKSLLTLGTVISKLTDGKATHIPYRESKLTRLLQSSLNGHGRVSLICTITPSSSNMEETHNTLKFGHRAKHIEIQAAQNKIIDEKSLIKKYQNEIHNLKEELEKLKQGFVTVPQFKDTGGDDLVLLKRKFEDGEVKLKSRLEQEEEAKSALLGRIHRLTKLILVSSKDSQSLRFPHLPDPRRRHSFGEEELAYLPYKRRDLVLDSENNDCCTYLEGSTETVDDTIREKKTKKHGLLNWLKPRKRDSSLGALTSISDTSNGVKYNGTPSAPQREIINSLAESRHCNSLFTDLSSDDLLSEARLDTESFSDNVLGPETPQISVKAIDLLREQKMILSGEAALHTSTLKHLYEEMAKNPGKEQIHDITKLNDEIKKINVQRALLEKKIVDSIIASHDKMDKLQISQSVVELAEQLSEKSFELEVKIADNRIIQEQLSRKNFECEELQETIRSLKQQLSDPLESRTLSMGDVHSQFCTETEGFQGVPNLDKENVLSNYLNEGLRVQTQACEIEELKGRMAELTKSKEQLEHRNQKLAEESSYAKGLASAAAVELKALSEEVAKLMTHNERLSSEVGVLKNSQRRNSISSSGRNGRRGNSFTERLEQGASSLDMKRELALSREREYSYETAFLEKDQREAELQRRIEDSKQREAYLENELANMWVLVAKLKSSHRGEVNFSASPGVTD